MLLKARIGFANRESLADSRSRTLAWIALKSLIPLLGLIAIDLTQHSQWLASLLLVIPLEGLSNQFRQWKRYITCFGFPNPKWIATMWALDRHRAYSSLSNRVDHSGRGDFRSMSAICFLLALGSVAVWRLTGWLTTIYPGILLSVIAMKAPIRRGRPPAVLFLANSNPDSSQLQLRLQFVVRPFEVTSCLFHGDAEDLLNDLLQFFCFRTGDNIHWKQIVDPLIEMTAIAVIDARQAKRAVDYEIDKALETLPHDRLFFLVDDSCPERIPKYRRFTEGEMLAALAEWRHLMAPVKTHAKQSEYVDERNGYFSITLPTGWVVEQVQDPRTKVVFRHPYIPDVAFRLIVRAAPTETFVAMMANSEARLKRARSLGIDASISEVVFLGRRCMQMRSVSHSIVSVIHTFLTSGLHFNIQYSAPTQALFDRHEGEVLRSLSTLQITNPFHGEDKTETQLIANRIRLSRLLAEHFGVAEARREIEEALEEFPDSKRLREELERIEREGTS